MIDVVTKNADSQSMRLSNQSIYLLVPEMRSLYASSCSSSTVFIMHFKPNSNHFSCSESSGILAMRWDRQLANSVLRRCNASIVMGGILNLIFLSSTTDDAQVYAPKIRQRSRHAGDGIHSKETYFDI
jgi:hypothetical protein